MSVSTSVNRPAPSSSRGTPILASKRVLLAGTVLCLCLSAAAEHSVLRPLRSHARAPAPVRLPALRAVASPFSNDVLLTLLRGGRRASNICRLPDRLNKDAANRGPLLRLANARPNPVFDPALIKALLHATPHKRGHARHARAPDLTGPSIEGFVTEGVATPDTLPGQIDIGKLLSKGAADIAAMQLAPVAPSVPHSSIALGPFSTAAKAGTLDGAAAASVDVGYTIAGVHLDTAGTTDVSNFAEPITARKFFKVQTAASIPLE